MALTVDIIERLCEEDRTLFCDYLQLCEFLNFALVVCDMRLMKLWVYIAHQSVVPKFFGLSVLLCRQGTPRKRKGPLKGTKGWDRFRTEEAFYTNPNPECLCFQSQHVEKNIWNCWREEHKVHSPSSTVTKLDLWCIITDTPEHNHWAPVPKVKTVEKHLEKYGGGGGGFCKKI